MLQINDFAGIWFRQGKKAAASKLIKQWQKEVQSLELTFKTEESDLYLYASPTTSLTTIPVKNISGRYTSCFKGILYNRTELQHRYTLPTSSKPHNDINIVAAAFHHSGTTEFSKFDGDFALSIWDEQTRQLTLARDRFGARCLYYTILPDGVFAFATHLKTLRNIIAPLLSYDEERIALHLLDLVNDKEKTFYAQIKRLLPGHAMSVTAQKNQQTPYWAFSNIPPSSTIKSDLEYAEEFRSLFLRSVAKRVPTESNYCISLSGGLDSSSVSCAAAYLNHSSGVTPPSTYSMLYSSPCQSDERSYIQAVVDKHNLSANYCEANDVDLLDELDTAVDVLCEPYDNPYFSLGWHFWKRIKQSNFDVVLDGIDGDVTVSYHFGYLTELAQRGRLLSLLRECVGISRNFYHDEVSPFSIFWKRGIRPLFPESDFQYENRPILNHDFQQQVGASTLLENIINQERAHYSSVDRHIFDITHPVMAQSLEQTNALAGHFGLEHRHPYMDKDLIDYCIQLPRPQKINDGWTRPIMRRALQAELPRSIFYRGGKWNPSTYFINRLRKESWPQVEQMLLDNQSLLGTFIDLDIVQSILQQGVTQINDNDFFLLMRLYIFTLWLQNDGLQDHS